MRDVRPRYLYSKEAVDPVISNPVLYASFYESARYNAYLA